MEIKFDPKIEFTANQVLCIVADRIKQEMRIDVSVDSIQIKYEGRYDDIYFDGISVKIDDEQFKKYLRNSQEQFKEYIRKSKEQ